MNQQTKIDPDRWRTAIQRMYSIWQGTDGAPDCVAVQAAREKFREAMAKANGLDDHRRVAAIEKALARYDKAVEKASRFRYI